MQAAIAVHQDLPNLDTDSLKFAEAARDVFWRLSGNQSDPERTRHYQEATMNADSICSLVPSVYAGFEALLQSIVIQAWTAFETLVKRLLKRSVKNHAECFPHLTGTEKFGFQKRDVFRRAYKIAFQDHTRIQNLMEDESVDALSELRNLLIHNAGIVDDEFHEACLKMHSPAWAALPVDQPFEITGIAVRSLIDSNVRCGYALITAVDDWLTANKPS